MCFTSVGAQLFKTIANLDESENKTLKYKYCIMQDMVNAGFFFLNPDSCGGKMNIFIAFWFIICQQHFFFQTPKYEKIL